MSQEDQIGTAAPVPGPGPMVPVVGAARWSVALLGVSAAVQLLILYTNVTVWTDGLDGAGARRQWGDTELLQALALIFTGSAFLVWFRRTRDNAGLLDPDGQRMRPGWAIGSWLIPLLNLWLPKRMADDMWRASSAGPRTLLTAWWSAWVGSFVVATAGSLAAEDAVTHADLRPALVAYVANDVLILAAAALAVAVVRRLTACQTRAFAPTGA